MKHDKDDYLILPDEELKAQFKHDKHLIWLISLPMLPLLYLIFVTFPGAVTLDVSDFVLCVSAAAGFVCYSFIFIEDPQQQRKLVRTLDIFQLVIFVIGIAAVITERRFIELSAIAGFIAASNGANFIAHPIIEDLHTLRSHPRYPFDNWRREESVLSGMYSSGIEDDKAARYLEHTMNRGKVYGVGREEYLEGDKKEYETPKPDPEKNLQQHKQIWRRYDKSDTTYTMDNLKNMYFDDGLENGELTGDELAKKLWEETRPKKPKDPPPEDFFQQSPIIWRTNKDGSSAMERREAGSGPSGEFDSRSVLP